MLRFGVLSAIWGASFALIKVAVDAGVAPIWVACWRCVFGAVTLLALCAARRDRLPRDAGTWGHAVVLALLLNAVPFALLADGERRVSSVLAGVLNATTPLTTLVFVLLLVPSERLTGRRLAGLGVGFAGVLTVLGVWQAPPGGTVAGALLCLGSTTCYGAGFAYTRRFFSGRDGSAVALSAAQIGAAAVELLLVAPVLGGAPRWPGWAAAGALLALGAAGTGIAYVLNLGVVRRHGAAVAATVTYLTPVWATLLGGLLLAEPVHWYTLAGGLTVVAGIVLTRHSPTADPIPAPASIPARTPDPTPATKPGTAADSGSVTGAGGGSPNGTPDPDVAVALTQDARDAPGAGGS